MPLTPCLTKLRVGNHPTFGPIDIPPPQSLVGYHYHSLPSRFWDMSLPVHIAKEPNCSTRASPTSLEMQGKSRDTTIWLYYPSPNI